MSSNVDGEHIGVTGLASGQLVVSAGVQRLKEGQTVRLLDNRAVEKQEQP